jgi:hypothetical protein
MVPLLDGISFQKAELEELYGFLMKRGELKKENGRWRGHTGYFGGNYGRWFWLGIKSVIPQTRRSAFFFALGTSTGTILLGLSGFFGIALLFKTVPWIYLSLKLLGGTYLICLGLKLIISNAKAGSNHKVSFLSTDKENDGKMRENGQEQRGRNDGAPSRSLAGS